MRMRIRGHGASWRHSGAADAPDIDALSDAELVAYAREKGLPPICAAWKRETIINKLKEL